MKNILFIITIIFTINAQQILQPNKNYTFNDTMVIFTEKQYNKLDSLITDYQTMKEENSLLEQKNDVLSLLDKAQKDQIFNLEKRDTLNINKIELYKQREELINDKAKIYKELYTDINNTVANKNKKTNFFNNTFWFGTGSAVGIITVFVCSIILGNISK